MSVQISFDDLPVDTVVGTQYGSSGVDFTVPGIVVSDSFAPSPSQVLQATERSGAVEFPDWHIKGHFSSPGHSHLGLSANMSVTIAVFDTGGGEVGRSSITIDQPNGAYTYGEVLVPLATIASFDVWTTSQNPFSLDNLIFDDLTVPQLPDFRLLYTGGPISIKPGGIEFATLTVLRLNQSSGPINFSVSSLPTAIFTANATPNPFLGGNGDKVNVGFEAQSWSNNNPVVYNQAVVVSGVPSPQAGTSTRTVNIPITVLEPYDVQIVGMEVTQAIQPMELPKKNNPDVLESVEYNGVPLGEGGMTRVRVFCTWKLLGRQNDVFDLKLYGSRDGSILAGSPLSPEQGFLPIYLGDNLDESVTPQLRQQPQADFVLPQDWTHGSIILRAELGVTQDFSSPDSFDTNLDNNTFVLTDIIFTKLVDLSIDAFELRIQDHYVGPPWIAFADMVNTLPLGANQINLGDYVNVVDITDIATQPNGDGPIGRAHAANDRLSHTANGWGFEATGRNFLVGVFSGDFQFVMTGTTLGDGFWDGVWDAIAGKQRVSVVQDYGRPLTSVAHEVGHLCGRKHAGLGPPPVEAWPPDGTGQINGVGVDRRDGRILYPGQAAPPLGIIYDFMSYAMPQGQGDPNFWISVRGWNEAFDWFRPGPFDDLGLDALRALSSTVSAMSPIELSKMTDGKVQKLIKEASTKGPAKSLLTVQVIVNSSGVARISAVYPSEDQHPLVGPKSQFSVVVKDKSAKILTSAHPQQQFLTDTPAAQARPFSLKASIPISSYSTATIVEVYHDDVLIASQRRPKNTPTVTNISVTAVPAHDGMPSGCEVTWSSTHADGLPLLAQVDVLLPPSHPLGNVWQSIYIGPAKALGPCSTSALPETLFPANPCAQVRVRVSDGFNEVRDVSEEFSCPGLPPRVRIVYPTGGAKFAVGAHVYLHAEAYDDLRRRIIRPGKSGDEKAWWTVNGVVVGEGEIVSWVPGPQAWRDDVKVRFEAVDYLGRSSCSEIDLTVVRRS
jgi:hypothetical protein